MIALMSQTKLPDSSNQVSDIVGAVHFFSHQDNWLRHQLRSLLTNRSPEHLICALYGHEHPDQEAMHPMSSLSINELKALSADLEKVAVELNLRQVEVNIYG